MESFSNDWFLIPILINLILLAFIRYNYKGYILQVLISSVNYTTSSKLYRENKNAKQRSGFLLTIIFLISATVFLFQLIKYFLPNSSDYNTLLILGFLFVCIILLILFNKLINLIIGILFVQQDISAEYNHNIDFFNQTAGLILFPVTILIIYSSIPATAIYFGIFSFAAIFILRIIRLFKININKQINIFYMFLYLCGVEIIPIIYLMKTLILI